MPRGHARSAYPALPQRQPERGARQRSAPSGVPSEKWRGSERRPPQRATRFQQRPAPKAQPKPASSFAQTARMQRIVPSRQSPPAKRGCIGTRTHTARRSLCQLDLAHFDAFIWASSAGQPGALIVVIAVSECHITNDQTHRCADGMLYPPRHGNQEQQGKGGQRGDDAGIRTARPPDQPGEDDEHRKRNPLQVVIGGQRATSRRNAQQFRCGPPILAGARRG